MSRAKVVGVELTEREQTIIDVCFRPVWEARQFLKAAPGTAIGYAAARAIYAMGWQAALSQHPAANACPTKCATCGGTREKPHWFDPLRMCAAPFHTEPRVPTRGGGQADASRGSSASLTPGQSGEAPSILECESGPVRIRGGVDRAPQNPTGSGESGAAPRLGQPTPAPEQEWTRESLIAALDEEASACGYEIDEGDIERLADVVLERPLGEVDYEAGMISREKAFETIKAILKPPPVNVYGAHHNRAVRACLNAVEDLPALAAIPALMPSVETLAEAMFNESLRGHLDDIAPDRWEYANEAMKARWVRIATVARAIIDAALRREP